MSVNNYFYMFGFLFNGIAIFVCYLKPKPSLEKNSSYPI